MIIPLGVVCLFLCSFLASAQVPAPGGVATRSVSGQFVVRSTRAPGETAPFSSLQTNRDFVCLSPALVPVSCERLKELVWRELGVSGPWSGKVFLNLYPAYSAADTLLLTCDLFREGWQYALNVPEVVDRSRFVRGVVQATVLELANRGAVEHSAEVPAWLVEGLSRELLASNDKEVLVPTLRRGTGTLPLGAVNLNAYKKGSLEQAHRFFTANTPLTFEELSWPGPEAWEGESGERFGFSAQLLVSELHRLTNGPACLRAFVAELPQHYNWQFAFFHAFQAQFPQPLEVEKWWSLRVLHFCGRDLTQTWSAAQSRETLDELLRPAAQVRATTNSLPQPAEAQLQTVIRDWDYTAQTATLQAKLRELELARLRMAPDWVPLVDQYHQVIQTFLRGRDKSGLTHLRSKDTAQRRAAEEAIKQLNALDAQRQTMRQTQIPVAKDTQAPRQ